MRHVLVDDPTAFSSLLETRGGHIGPTSGPPTAGSQRTTAVTIGPASCQLTSHIRLESAGHLEPPGISDTEKLSLSRRHGVVRVPSDVSRNDRDRFCDSRHSPAATRAIGVQNLCRNQWRTASPLLGCATLPPWDICSAATDLRIDQQRHVHVDAHPLLLDRLACIAGHSHGHSTGQTQPNQTRLTRIAAQPDLVRPN